MALVVLISTITTNEIVEAENTVEEEIEKEFRPVYIVTDNIHNKRYDTEFMHNITVHLEEMNIPATVYMHPTPAAHNKVLLDPNVPEDAVILEIAYLCSGTMNSKGKEWYKQRLRDRDLIFINVSPTDLRDLDWLPRAWDDNFSPPSFRGLSNPYEYLKQNDIGYVMSTNPKEIATEIREMELLKQ